MKYIVFYHNDTKKMKLVFDFKQYTFYQMNKHKHVKGSFTFTSENLIVMFDKTKPIIFTTCDYQNFTNENNESLFFKTKLSITNLHFDRYINTYKDKVEIVVAKYNENVDWLIPYNTLITIYDKGSTYNTQNNIFKNIIDLPNVGRESHTYLHHIVNNYDNLKEYTVFIQGKIYDHTKFQLNDYIKNKNPFFSDINMKGTIFASNNAYGYLEHTKHWLQEYNNGHMEKELLDFETWFNMYIKKTLPPITDFVWSHGACFCVTKTCILSNPKSYYETLLLLLSNHVNPECGHYFERSWYYIFQGKTINI